MITLDLSILNQKGTPMFYSDTLALRPTFGIAGRIFIAIDSPYGIFRDTGSAWDQIAGSGGGGIGGSGTATQIAFFSAATTLTSSVNLFWDNTNARLGINTATPGSSLDIHSTVQSIIQANNTTLGNSFLLFLLQDVGKWQLGNVYNAGANYFRIRDQLNSLERFTIQNTGEIDFLGYSTTLNTLTGITGTTPSALTNSGFTNDFTFNSGISTSASVNAIGLLVDNGLNYSGANTINETSYNASGLFRIGLTFGSASATITYTQGATAQIRALTSSQVQYIQNGNNSGTISHYANIQILGDNKSGTGVTTFTNRYGLLINDFADFAAGNTYTNRWGIYQQGANENNFFAGKVGIGSSFSPGIYQLDVNGNVRFTGGVTGGNYNGVKLASSPGTHNVYIGNSAADSATSSMNHNVVLGHAAANSMTSGNWNVIIGRFSVQLPTTINNSILIGPQNLINYTSAITDILSFSVGNSTAISYPLFATDILSSSPSFRIGGNNGLALNAFPSVTASAILDLTSTTKGFLPPRMTTTEKNAIATPAQGLFIFDTTLVKLCVYNGTAWETVTSI